MFFYFHFFCIFFNFFIVCLVHVFETCITQFFCGCQQPHICIPYDPYNFSSFSAFSLNLNCLNSLKQQLVFFIAWFQTCLGVELMDWPKHSSN